MKRKINIKFSLSGDVLRPTKYYKLSSCSYELNGQDCIITNLCDAKQYLIPGKSLVEDVLNVVFR